MEIQTRLQRLRHYVALVLGAVLSVAGFRHNSDSFVAAKSIAHTPIIKVVQIVGEKPHAH